MKTEIELREIAERFCLEGEVEEIAPYGSGHINDTYRVTCRSCDSQQITCRYILQRMNHQVFKNPRELMDNVVHVTDFLQQQIRKNGGDPRREAINVIPDREGRYWVELEDGSCWRMYLFVEGATSYDAVERPEDFYESAVAFGHFQKLLADFPADSLFETIPDFHNTVDRLEQFMTACERDPYGRAADVEPEIRFVLDRKAECGVLCEMLERGEIPLRVTHNDTKLNNILIDDVTGKGICVIDLDTVMPGLLVNDFGDSIRFGASTADEDEPDLAKVSFDLHLYEVYTKGFLEGCAGAVTDRELSMLPMGAILMTFECGMRFLTDYLEGDHYYKIHRKEHNLDRCRTQFKLVADMEKQLLQMREIVEHYRLSGQEEH